MFTAKLHPLKESIKSDGAGGKATEGGSCYSKAAGGGSRRRLIRKYKPTSTVALATLAARHMKIKHKGKKKKKFSSVLEVHL